ncbi:MAG: MFS transporter [Candidatus Coproplasma sp.]
MTKARKYEIKWILYDVGNSAFTLLVSSVLPIYFNYLASQSGVSATDATAIWGYAASIVTLCVAILGPTLGAMTDFKEMKRPFFFFSAIIGVIGCAALGIPTPWLIFLVIFVITKIAYSTSLIFYDSMLVDVADMKRVDSVSAQGYALGYIGSCIPFIISIVIINFTSLPIAISMPVAVLINAVWWLAFTLPIAKSYKQLHFIERTPHAVRENFKRLFSVFAKKSNVQNKKGILLFLLAFFFYIDGVYTIIDMATSFGTALGFDTTQLLLALLVTQFVAFPAALIFGKLCDKIRNDMLILVSICVYTGVAVFAVFMNAVWQFWVLAVVVGMFQGGIQALSRSYFTKIIPAEQSGCLFGIMDIFGKGAAFLGTLLVGIVTSLTGSVNLGAIPIACLFVAGILTFVFAARENSSYIVKRQTEAEEITVAISQTEETVQ